MNANALNLALAKWDGYKFVDDETGFSFYAPVRYSNGTVVSEFQQSFFCKSNKDNVKTSLIPRYTESLDAVWQLEEKLTHEQRIDYLCTLEAYHFKGDQNYETFWYQVHATALQRCEAIARVLQLCQD